MIRFARRHPVWAGVIVIVAASAMSAASNNRIIHNAANWIAVAVVFFWIGLWIWNRFPHKPRKPKAPLIDPGIPRVSNTMPTQTPPAFVPIRQAFAIPTLGDVLMLTAAQFEELGRDLLMACGFQCMIRSGGAGDLGADVKGRDRQGRSVVVQCKRYAPGNQVGSPVMQSFIGMMTVQHHADRGVFITSATFSLPAVQLAQAHGVTLIDGPTLLTLMALTGVGCGSGAAAPAYAVPALVADAFIPAGTTAFLAGNGRVVNPPRPPKFCTNCGRAIEGDGAFCPECGAGIKRG